MLASNVATGGGASGGSGSGAAGAGDSSVPGGTSGPGDGPGSAPKDPRDPFPHERSAGVPPASGYPQASPRSGMSTAPPGVVTPVPSVVTPAPVGVITPGAVVPGTPLICPSLNPSDPHRC